MNNKVQIIQYLLQKSYDDGAWVSVGILPSLEDISAEMAFAKPLPNAHNIAELVWHLTAWRNFAIKRLEGDTDFDITESEQNYPTIEMQDENQWKIIVAELAESQKQLSDLLSKITDNQLLTIVARRTYTFEYLLHGIIQHDFYHLGQIILLKKQLKGN